MSLGPTAEPNVQVTGKVLPGIVKTGQLPRKADSFSVSKVADITTTFKGRARPSVAFAGLEKIFFNRPRRISCNKSTYSMCALRIYQKKGICVGQGWALPPYTPPNTPQTCTLSYVIFLTFLFAKSSARLWE